MERGKQIAVVLNSLFVLIILNTYRPIKTEEFTVYTTTSCPTNQSEWSKRSSAINCTETHGYTCLPNDEFTELMEFCYTLPRIGITKGLCLFLYNKSRINWYVCNTFTDGCPDLFYFSDTVYKYPNCVRIGNGCFLAEPSCQGKPYTSLSTTTTAATTTETETTHVYSGQAPEKNDWIWVATITLGVLLLFCIAIGSWIIYRTKVCVRQECLASIQDPIEVEGFLLSGNRLTAQNEVELEERLILNEDDTIPKITEFNTCELPENPKKLSEQEEALFKACKEGDTVSVERLLASGVGVNFLTDGADSAQNKDVSEKALFKPKEDHAIPEIVVLYNREPSENQKMLSEQEEALLKACKEGDTNSVKRLLASGVKVNFSTDSGSSPLYIACLHGKDNIVQILLDNGAALNNESFLLHAASIFGYDNIVNLLLDRGLDINSKNNVGASPLFIACQRNCFTTVQLLISRGADVNFCVEEGLISPLFVACEKGNTKMAKLLLDEGVDINFCNARGISPLYRACQNGHYNTVMLLLERGADINLCDNEMFSPLYVACQNGHDKVVQLLLEKGAKVDLCEYGGASPLHVACNNKHDDCVELLLSKGAKVNLLTNNGNTPLYIACKSGNMSTVQILLRNGADVNLFNNDNFNPLVQASYDGRADIVQTLLDCGAEVNAPGVLFGCTPLILACLEGDYDTVKVLVSNGANVNDHDADKESPLSLAIKSGNKDIVEFLKENGAKQ